MPVLALSLSGPFFPKCAQQFFLPILVLFSPVILHLNSQVPFSRQVYPGIALDLLAASGGLHPAHP